jgi:hypothetical protein
VGNLGIYGSTSALFDARARLGEAVEHVSAIRKILALGDLSCGVLKRHYFAVVSLLRKARALIDKIDRTDFDSAEQAYAIRDARQLAATYNRTLDEMLPIQATISASCSREPIYRR